MEFIIDNLVWFIAGGVVILMTIIGYFAEKTDFGKNLSSSTDDDVKEDQPKKEKVKPVKKEKKSKKEEIKEEIKEEFPQNQPLEQEYAAELPIPALSEFPAVIEQQNIEPVALAPVDVVENNYTEPELVVEPIIQTYEPVDLQTSAIEDGNIKIQPLLEAEPIVPIYQEPVADTPTMINIVPDVLPTIVDEIDTNNVVEPTVINEVVDDNEVVEPTFIADIDDNSVVIEPTIIDEINNSDAVVEPTVIDDVDKNSLVDEPINIDQTPQVIPEYGVLDVEPIEKSITTGDETPVVITDEKIVPFDHLSATMEMPPIMMEQGIPSANMELSNFENIVQDNEQSEEEDIWKF